MDEGKILENHKIYAQRLERAKEFGFDVNQNCQQIIDLAQPIRGKILEVGTGKGHFCLNLAQAGYRFKSIDLSSQEQEIARLNLKYLKEDDQVDFLIADARRLPFEDQYFDIVFAVNVAHHLDEPLEVAQEILRVVKQGGKMICTDFNDEGFNIIHKMHYSEGHHHPAQDFRLSDIERALAQQGYEIKKHHTPTQDICIIHK